MKLPTITNKQSEILTLIYRFRFLTRKQIQTILKHKYPSKIFTWLNDLTKHEYLIETYEKNFNNLPVIYSLGKNGRKYLRRDKKIGKLLERVRKEAKSSSRFRDHCLFVANIYISLLSFGQEIDSQIHFYTKTDLYGMEHLISPHPDAYFAIEDKKGNIKRYFLEVFNENLRTNIFRHRVKAYLTYYDSDDWQDNTDKPFPEIILVCSTVKLKNHLYYYISQKLDEDDHPNFYLTTKDIIQSKGITRDSLEKILPKE